LANIQADLLRSSQRSAIEHLATGIAHEIHNPLTIISGKAQILLLKRDQKSYDAQVEEVLKTIVKQTRRAADITRKLLMFSETQKSAKEWIDLETVVNDTIALLSYQVSLDQIQVIKRFEHPMPRFWGNVSELREVFLNLFLNAVEAIGKKGTVEVSGRYRDADKVFEFCVSDTGPGIPESDFPKLFHPFFTTRPEGVGLGLFVTQQIVHGYQGSIRAENRAPQGITFVVELSAEEGVQLSKTAASAGEQQVLL
jgi:signal transduction histidine kinase